MKAQKSVQTLAAELAADFYKQNDDEFEPEKVDQIVGSMTAALMRTHTQLVRLWVHVDPRQRFSWAYDAGSCMVALLETVNAIEPNTNNYNKFRWRVRLATMVTEFMKATTGLERCGANFHLWDHFGVVQAGTIRVFTFQN